MKNQSNTFKITISLLSMMLLLVNYSQGQIHSQSKVLVAKSFFKQKKLLIQNGDLGRINSANYLVGKYHFENLRVVKTESKRYYLMAEDQNSDQIFAFELMKKGRRLFISKYQEMHVCSEENGGINTFLLENGKIVGCQLGNHTISVGGTPAQKDGE
jgi:hypothetical protein